MKNDDLGSPFGVDKSGGYISNVCTNAFRFESWFESNDSKFVQETNFCIDANAQNERAG